MNNYNTEEITKLSNIPPNSIIYGDCFDIMPLIKDNSIDLILCDLPFGITKCRWDIPLNLDKLWIEYKRIIKPNGAILLFGKSPFDKILGVSNLKMLKYEWIWEKTQATGYFNAKKMPMSSHESILVFYKSPPTYNPQKTIGHKPINSYTKRVDVQNKTQLYGKVTKEIKGGGETDRYPRSVIKFSSDKQTCHLHDTQKPLSLMEYFVKTYTNEGDLILDNTAGSGTTGLAAKNLNRNYILIENDEIHYKTCCERLK